MEKLGKYIKDFLRTIELGYSFDLTRADRQEYIVFLIGCIFMTGIFMITGHGLLNWMFQLAMVIPLVMLNIRRLHDLGVTGWIYLPVMLFCSWSVFFATPFTILLSLNIFGVYIIVMSLLKGESINNKYGLRIER